jgi:predicted MFS family arabinose efflux permease
VGFFVAGALTSAWVSRIPVVKHDLGLGAAQLSIALAGIPAGLLIAMRIVPGLIAWRSSAFVARSAIILGAGALVCLGVMWDLVSLAICLAVFGIALGATDIAVNVQGAAVERAYGRPLMSRLHAMYSLGILLGAFLGSVTIGLGLSSPLFFLGAAAALLVLGLSGTRSLLGREADATVQSSTPDARRPTQMRLLKQPRLLAAGVVAFSGLFAEGAVNDWAGVFLHQVRGASFSFAALAAGACGCGMAIGRLTGDTLIERAGRQPTLAGASILAAAAMSMALLIPARAASLAAFGLLGAVLATIVPSSFSLAGSMPGLAPAWAISRLTTIGYLGTFGSPVVIGFLAGVTGLTAAMMLPAAFLLVVLPASWVARETAVHDARRAPTPSTNRPDG